MEILTVLSRYLNFLLALLGVICMTKIVYRTEKRLDKVFKLFHLSASVLLIATILDLSFYWGIVPGNWAKIIILVSRALALLFFFLAGCQMIKLINEESCK